LVIATILTPSQRSQAITEVLEQCVRSLSGASLQAGILLAAIDFEHTLILNQIHESYPGIELIGGTTDGEMSSILGFEQDSLTLMLFCSDNITIRAGIGHKIYCLNNTGLSHKFDRGSKWKSVLRFPPVNVGDKYIHKECSLFPLLFLLLECRQVLKNQSILLSVWFFPPFFVEA
jgi:hypothetical protein